MIRLIDQFRCIEVWTWWFLRSLPLKKLWHLENLEKKATKDYSRKCSIHSGMRIRFCRKTGSGALGLTGDNSKSMKTRKGFKNYLGYSFNRLLTSPLNWGAEPRILFLAKSGSSNPVFCTFRRCGEEPGQVDCKGGEQSCYIGEGRVNCSFCWTR